MKKISKRAASTIQLRWGTFPFFLLIGKIVVKGGLTCARIRSFHCETNGKFRTNDTTISSTGNYTPLIALIETHYLPSIAYFSSVVGKEQILLERCEHFVKQTYRNRCHINSANGKTAMVVPVTSKHGKSLITDVRLDFTQKWVNNHWRTVQSAYGKAPFFDHYCQDLHDILFGKVGFLYELNYMLLSMCLKWLRWSMPVKETEIYSERPQNNVLDLRFAINAKKLEQCHQFYYPVTYNQVFGNTFVENLSLIDLVFCEGPGASSIVQGSAIQKMNK